MGKPTGFLEYTRREDGRRPAAERVRDWEEFHLPLPEEIRRQQGARCMNCGVPFCQAGMIYEGKTFGCPLHNLIPEWNDMILSGNWGHALSRLLKANSFPEFTGRVCPAPCENACICGIYGDPITVRDNELSIIEAAFGAGKLRPRRPPQWSGKKVCVVGSGPAGLAAADQLNRRGHMVTVIERAEHPGGLLMYGIPNMKLPKSVVRRRIDLMTEEGVTFVCGVDASEGAVAKRLLAEYDAVILCCGAGAPRPLGLDTTGISGVCYGTEYLKAAVERAQFGKAEAAVPSASGLDGYHRHWRYRQRLCGHRPAARLPLRDPAGAPSPDGLPGRCGKPAAGLRPRRGAGRYGPGSPAVWRPGPEPGGGGKRFPDRCGHHGGGYPALPAVDRRHRLCRV